MNDPKPLASLSGRLLARKGNARPAMRPQVQRLDPEDEIDAVHLEDLGWDDMGEAEAQPRNSDILPLTPTPVTPEAKAEAEAEDRAAAAQLAAHAKERKSARTSNGKANGNGRIQDPPEVVRQRDMLARKLAAEPAAEEQHSRSPKPKGPARGKARAAFTLRLDAERHLKLRLASTINGRSAQQLMTKALDRLIADMPEIELLAAQLKKGGKDSAN